MGEDEDIYLAASTVLKTTVVHFAELPRGTRESTGGSRDGAQGRGTHEGESEKGKKKRGRKKKRRRGNEMEPVASRKLKQKA